MFEGRDAESLKKLAQALIAQPGTIALLGSRDKDTARLVFARSSDAAGDMSLLMREACVMLDGRGGGKPELAQVVEKLVDQLEAVISQLASKSIDLTVCRYIINGPFSGMLIWMRKCSAAR